MKSTHPIRVLVSYPDLDANGTRSNELHIWMIDNFGLTGDRYRFHPELDYLIYSFRDEKDAVFFTLRWGGRIRKTELVE